MTMASITQEPLAMVAPMSLAGCSRTLSESVPISSEMTRRSVPATLILILR